MITANTTNTQNTSATPQSVNSLAKTVKSQTLSQGDFLRLLVTQVKNQDPTKPMDSTQFVSQLAQFSALAGVTELNSTMQGVAKNVQSAQLVQGASLVGHQVLAPGSIGELTENFPLTGAVKLPNATNGLTIRIMDGAGSLVKSFDMGSQNSGLIPFSWDGTHLDGSKAPFGNYYVEANYLENDKLVGANTLIAARVNSVSLASAGLTLSVQNLGEMNLEQVELLM